MYPFSTVFYLDSKAYGIRSEIEYKEGEDKSRYTGILKNFDLFPQIW